MMLARVADSLYWIGRYIERAEHMSRLSDVMLNATLDQNDAAVQVARVALRKGSLVVNSSQGGGSKDTWVLSK